MIGENEEFDRKSLRKIQGKQAAWTELAIDCVAFANGTGGRLLIGIEDSADRPPAEQRIAPALLDLLRKRIQELTVNVSVFPQLVVADNQGEYIELSIARSFGIASTTDGRYFMRVGDSCVPIVGDQILQLLNDRPTLPWETLTHLRVSKKEVTPAQAAFIVGGLRNSDRVKSALKEKSDMELLEHYGLVDGDLLTNLGVLFIGYARDRARLGSAPLV
ncbi:MAG: ATP-binding protein [Pseudomonas oryzihabitans]